MRADEFRGRIGRTVADSEAWFDEPPHPGDGGAERRRGAARRHRLRPARLLRVRHRHARTSTPWPPAGCSSRTSTSRRCARPTRAVAAHRPGAPRGRHAGACRTSAPASPTSSATSRTTPPPWPRCCTTTGYATFCVGKWHLAPMEQCSAAGPFDQWPLGPGLRPLLRLPRGRDRPVPPRAGGRQPPGRPAGRSRRRLPPVRGPGRPGAADGRRLRRRAPRPALLRLPRLRRHPRAPPGAARVPRQVPGPLRRGLGRGPRALVRAPARARRDPGRHPRWRHATRGSSRGTSCPRTSSGSPPGCRRRSPRSSTTPTTRSAGSSTGCAALGQLDDTILVVLADNGASQEGGPYGVLHEMKFFNGILETPDEAVGPHRRHRRPAQPHQLPVGLGAVRQHPVPLVQAEHPRGRRPRADGRALAGRHRRRPAGHEAGPVRLRRRHRPHDLRAARRRGRPAVRNGLEQLPVTGHSFAAVLADAGGAGHQHRCSTSRRPAAGRSSPAEWKAVCKHVAGADFDTEPWELYHLADDRSECRRPRRARARPAADADRAVVGRGRAPRRAAARRPHHRAVRRPLPRRARRTRPTAATCTGRPCRRCPARRGAAIGGRSFDLTARRSRTAATDEGVLFATGTENSGCRCSCRTTAWSSTTTRSTTTPSSSPTSTVPDGRRRARRPAPAARRLRRHGDARRSTAPTPGTADLPLFMRMMSSVGPSVGFDHGSAVSARYAAPVPLHRHPARGRHPGQPGPLRRRRRRPTARAEMSRQ